MTSQLETNVPLKPDHSLAEASAAFDRLSADIDLVLARVCCVEPLDAYAFSFVSLPRKLRLLLDYLQFLKGREHFSLSDFRLIERIQLAYRMHAQARNEVVRQRGRNVRDEPSKGVLSASDIDRLGAELGSLMGSIEIDGPPGESSRNKR